MSTNERIDVRMFEAELAEAWYIAGMTAFEQYLAAHPMMDAIQIERQRQPFIEGFKAASSVPAQSQLALTQCVMLDPHGIVALSRHLLPYVMAFGRHARIAPGDMMAALLIVLVTIGRQMHPTLTNQQVFDVFSAEVGIILRALDKMQSAPADEPLQ